jgi:S1-C subfamily serine protease
MRILIRHLSGSKANQIEQVPIESFPELTIGREPGATIVFDAMHDDAVSRKHAVIKVQQGDPPGFKLRDLGSSNGTLLNGERLGDETELLPGDTIELGAAGPKFVFDLDPRPANLVARTRMINPAAAAATRIVDTAGGASQATAADVERTTLTKSSVGRNTIMRMLSEQRQAANRVGVFAVAGVLAVTGLVGGLLYYKGQTDAAEQSAQFSQQAAIQGAKNDEFAARIQNEMGLSPTQVVEKFGNATVLVGMQWRLYDSLTGKPLFHKTVQGRDGQLWPAYVMWNDRPYRWLTTENESHGNSQAGGAGWGSGFIVNDQGLTITNKHVAASWLVTYSDSAEEMPRGVFYQAQDKFYPKDEFAKKNPGQFVDARANPDLFKELYRWLPEEGGPLFTEDQPVVVPPLVKRFEGRNEELTVHFPGSRIDVNARLISTSPDADAALIKIDTTQSLASIPIAQDENVKQGDHVIVLGYPYFTAKNQASVTTTEAGQVRQKREIIPQPTVTEGNISNISLPVEQLGNLTIRGEMGHAYQLTVPSSHGNSGGPVFNSEGLVIGLFTYGSPSGRETVTFAVPIKYARELIKIQRTS